MHVDNQHINLTEPQEFNLETRTLNHFTHFFVLLHPAAKLCWMEPVVLLTSKRTGALKNAHQRPGFAGFFV